MCYYGTMLYINFRRRQGREATIHKENCPMVRRWMFHGLKGKGRGYWLQIWDEDIVEAVAQDLGTLRYPGCCHRERSGRRRLVG